LRISSKVAAAGFGAVALAAMAVAQDRPESILPPGFGDPAARPAARPSATPTAAAPRSPVARPGPAPTSPVPGGAVLPSDPAGAVVQPLPTPTPAPIPSATPSPVDPRLLARYEMPAYARRSLATVGLSQDMPADAFGAADGGFIETLMRHTPAPLPSRWLSMLVRRTLAAELDTPAGLNGADYAAERAWLLLRMGESVVARGVVERVDNRDYTPKLYQVAMNAMLATGDPGGLCPLAEGGLRATGEVGWVFAQPICAGLTGQGEAARAQFQATRRRRLAGGIDVLLAEKVMGAGGQGRRAVTIEWDGVDRLTPWRFGLANATGVAIPETMFATTGAQVRYWQALSPMLAPAARLALAEAAGAQGVLSSAALVDLYGMVAGDDDAPSAATAAAQDLGTAYAGRTADARLAALRDLWGADPSYGRLVLTAHAAARQPVRADLAEADRIVASLLSAGHDRTAARWAQAVKTGGDGWAMIALSDPDSTTRFGEGDVQGYASSGDAMRKRQLFLAGLAGLGRIAPDQAQRTAESLGVPLGAETNWTRALDRAVRADEPGTVVLLAAVGMNAANWRGVSPVTLYRIVAALRGVGLDGEARMIAAEALARG
jgi:hypothetical protein